MRRLAIEGSKDLAVRHAAIAALERAGAPDHDAGAAVAAVYDFVRSLRFVSDPVGTQAIQSPRATLFLRAGNCAQRATLLAAMLLSIGIPALLSFRVIAANPRLPHQFSHVYVVLAPGTVAGQRVALDPTYSTNPIGFEYPLPTRVGDFDL
jgi:transglutaminase-like putative cysteine protease